MMERAVILTASGNWFRDRLYEAGVDDLLSSIGLTADEAGKWCVLSIFVSLFLGVILGKAAMKIPSELESIEAMEKEIPGSGSRFREVIKNVSEMRIGGLPLGSLVRSAQYTTKLVEVIRSVVALSSSVAGSIAFVLTGNLASSLTVATTIYCSRSALLSRNAQKDASFFWSVGGGKRSLVDSIQRPSYKHIKSFFQKKLLEEEKKQESDEMVEEGDSASAEIDSETMAEEEVPSKEDAPESMLSLEMCHMLLRMKHKELTRALKSDHKLELSDRVVLESEKTELDGMLEKYSELDMETKEEKPLELNFFRDVKDRYKGGKK